MNDKLVWPVAVVLVIVIAGLAYMYGETTDAVIQGRILGYYERVLTFLIGAGSGGAIAGFVSFWHGFRKGQLSPR